MRKFRGTRWIATLGVVLAVGLSACAESEEAATETPPEILAERTAAFRYSCASRELVQTAAEDLALLEAAAASIDPANGADPMRVASQAASVFARSYHRHAELRATAYALMDSAVNHAATAEDSTRYAQRSEAFTFSAPAEGTVEANAMNSYTGKLEAILSDADHPCNWNMPDLSD